MFCQRCGNSVSPGKKFCGRCGSKIEIDPLASEEEISPLDPDKKSESLHAFSPLDSSDVEEKTQNAVVLPAENESRNLAMVSSPAILKKETKEKRALRILFSVLLTVCLVFFLFIASLLTICRAALSENSVKRAVDNLDFASLQLPVGTYGSRVKLSRYLFETLEGKVQGLTQEKIENFLSLPVVKEALKDGAEVYRGYLLDGRDTNGLSIEYITDYLLSHQENVKEGLVSAGLADNPEALHFDRESIEKIIRSEVGEELTIDRMIYGVEKEVGFAVFAISPFCLVVSWIAVCFFLFLLFFVNRRAFHSAFLSIGIAVLIVGCFFFCLDFTSRYWLKLFSLEYIKPIYDMVFSAHVLSCALVLLACFIFSLCMFFGFARIKTEKQEEKSVSPDV